MKDKQKRKKERTWAEAARMVSHVFTWWRLLCFVLKRTLNAFTLHETNPVCRIYVCL
uniref:Uncharacterized protein n=1 Tax=Oryzias sinensis TaxID=183150 RepID=A0A8C7Y920_9TELE